MTQDQQASLTQQLLDLTKQMLEYGISFSLSVTMDNFNFSASSQKMEQPFLTVKKKTHKSPSQKKRDQIRKKKFIEKKLGHSNSDNTSEPEETLFSCESCDYVNSKKRGLDAHIRQKHKLEQIDGNITLPEDSSPISTENCAFQCAQCEFKTNTEDELCKHVKWFMH